MLGWKEITTWGPRRVCQHCIVWLRILSHCCKHCSCASSTGWCPEGWGMVWEVVGSCKYLGSQNKILQNSIYGSRGILQSVFFRKPLAWFFLQTNLYKYKILWISSDKIGNISHGRIIEGTNCCAEPPWTLLRYFLNKSVKNADIPNCFFSLTFFSFLSFFFLNLSAHLFVCFLVTCKKVTCPDAPQLCEGVPLFSPSPPWAPSRTIHGSWTLGNHSHVFINHRFTQHVADFGRQFYPQYRRILYIKFYAWGWLPSPAHCEKKKKHSK